MSRIARTGVRAILSLFVFAVTAVSPSYFLNCRAQMRAAALLADVRALRVGESSEEDVKRIFQH